MRIAVLNRKRLTLEGLRGWLNMRNFTISSYLAACSIHKTAYMVEWGRKTIVAVLISIEVIPSHSERLDRETLERALRAVCSLTPNPSAFAYHRQGRKYTAEILQLRNPCRPGWVGIVSGSGLCKLLRSKLKRAAARVG